MLTRLPQSALFVCLLICGLSTAIAAAPPIVAAASVLRFALPEIADAFSARIGTAQLHSDGTLADLGDALVDGRLEHLAIANPETAPYGRAARQVLEHLGLWHKVQATLVIGENVAQAAQFAVSGTA